MAAAADNIQRIIHHFSHEHPLELTKLNQPQQGSAAVCAGCKFRASGVVYACRTCSNHILHITCSKPPKKIIHPSHQHHPLTLFAAPVYPEGVFACNACGRESSGFCYHCDECELDIDIICASLKLSVAHAAHPLHPLELVFSPPYGAGRSFVCDVCKKPGSERWLYRCAAGCDFDAHVACGHMSKLSVSPATLSKPRPVTNLQRLSSPRQSRDVVSFSGGGSPAAVAECASRGVVPYVGGGGPVGVGVAYAGEYSGGMKGGNLVGHMVQGFVEGCGQQVGQAVVQGILGGGSDSGSATSGVVLSSVISSVIGLN
ncbi:hypothetical protein H6P81_018383 [Aristolochia fimbriata]|uniref:DC1 domain-containing protein n=1 Tax=Aristolochia fimbriata TaxID=158543 RepID=A0AAV7E221_ARIFI|nr:hypothetical protein H6P81_018383 [Aristolochia fimbriata]